ncbi:hypothetical protein IV203_032905 [Nitzschia inconspicua]|uniref:Uncharacterized protein n=1 Tax=Nitzschia inconspicua TaxID=303405 RepID=A0A9K3PHQ3_9STRA|nr:hypothetical protein IV203_032905 [Nitzschia inconspicua]
MVACSSPIMPLFWQWYPIPDPLAPLGISIILRDYLSNRTMAACSSPIWRLSNNGGLLQPHYALILAMVSHSGSISPPRHFDNPTGLSFKSYNGGLLQPDLAFIKQWWIAPAPLCSYSGNGIPLRPIRPSRNFDNPTGLSFILRQLWLLLTPPAPAVLLIRLHPWFPSRHDVDIFDYLWPIPPRIFPVFGILFSPRTKPFLAGNRHRHQIFSQFYAVVCRCMSGCLSVA